MKLKSVLYSLLYDEQGQYKTDFLFYAFKLTISCNTLTAEATSCISFMTMLRFPFCSRRLQLRGYFAMYSITLPKALL